MLRGRIDDMRLAGNQQYAFHEYQDPHGNRLFAGDATGSDSFQFAQIKKGPGKANVAIVIVIYINGAFLEKVIQVRPDHISDLANYVEYNISYDISDTLNDTYNDIVLYRSL